MWCTPLGWWPCWVVWSHTCVSDLLCWYMGDVHITVQAKYGALLLLLAAVDLGQNSQCQVAAGESIGPNAAPT